MNGLPPPFHMCFSGNISENWRRWKCEFMLYLQATGKENKPDSVKVATLLLLIGAEGREEFSTFKFSEGEDSSNFQTVVEKFEKRCNPRKNTIFHRYLLWQVEQKNDEGIDVFATRLKSMALNCEYGNFTETIIRDRIIFGIKDDQLKERLLGWQPTIENQELTLAQTLDICRAAETTRAQLTVMKGNSDVPIEELKKVKQETQTKSTVNKKQAWKTDYQKGVKKTAQYKCGKCGGQHKFGACPAFGKRCHQCGQFNHFQQMCRNTHERENPENQKPKLHELKHEEEQQEFMLGELGIADVNPINKDWCVQIQTPEGLLLCKVDTGAQVNVLALHDYQSFRIKPELTKTGVVLKAYGGQKIIPVGKCVLECTYEKKNHKLDFYVVDIKATTILGLDSCLQLQLIRRIDELGPSNTEWKTKEDMILEFKDVFEGNGLFEGEVNLKVDATVQPVIKPPRKVPYTLQDKLKTTLQSMEERGIIKRVTHPTDWVSDMVIVEKPSGELRICLDARELNKALKRAHHQLPTTADAVLKLAGKKFYTIMDIKEGFWCVQLDQQSADLCTFHTPFGRYQFVRLPFGLSVSPEIFQCKLDEAFGDIEDSSRVTDDFAMAGSTIKQHDEVVRQVLKRAQESNIKFNKNKIQWRLTEVKYLGKKITEQGLKPDLDKVEAIREMPVPQNRTELKRFLGMVNFFAGFIPNLSKITESLRILLRNATIWIWEQGQQQAFIKLKNILSEEPVLAIFEPEKECVIQADASRQGLGACLMQEGRPVAYVSRSLTGAENNYAQIELELLSIVFACEKFYTYIYGRKVTVHTDHKPLISLVKKAFQTLSPRLQRLTLRLQRFNLELQYVPGKYMFVADTLSRASISTTTDD